MNSTNIPTLIEYMCSQNWGLKYSTFVQLKDILERHNSGQRLNEDEIAKIVATKQDKGSDGRQFEITRRGTAVIPVSGVIAKYSRMVNGVSQPRGTSIETLREQFSQAMNNTKVQQILLHIESPGGNINGLADFAQSVYEASFEKPVVAYIDDLGASAAYWIASQANKIYTNQTADVGSIGIYALYVDTSERAKQFGLKYMIFRSGKNKGIGAPGIEISEDNAKAIQENIDATHEIFVQTILKGRVAAGLDEESLRELADGRCFIGAESVQNKLVDGVMTFEQALAALETNPSDLRTETMIVAAASAEENNQVQKKEFAMEKKETNDAAAATDTERVIQAERQRTSSINEALADDAFKDLRKQAIADGLSLNDAKALAFDKSQEIHAAALAEVNEKLTKAQERLKAISEGGQPNATGQEPADENEDASTGKSDAGTAQQYEAAVEEFKKQGKTKAEAHRLAAHNFPESHDAWVQAQPNADKKKA